MSGEQWLFGLSCAAVGVVGTGVVGGVRMIFGWLKNKEAKKLSEECRREAEEKARGARDEIPSIEKACRSRKRRKTGIACGLMSPDFDPDVTETMEIPEDEE